MYSNTPPQLEHHPSFNQEFSVKGPPPPSSWVGEMNYPPPTRSLQTLSTRRPKKKGAVARPPLNSTKFKLLVQLVRV